MLQNMMISLLALLATDSTRQQSDSVRQMARSIVQNVTTTQSIDKLQEVGRQLADWGVVIGLRIISALAIFIMGRYVIKFINGVIKRLLNARNIDPSVKSFLESLINVLLLMLLAVAVVSKLGVETTSFAALLASFGVAVGMALSGNLQNFAGGVLILVFRPYKVGDYISAQGEEGTVIAIQIFHTVMRTYKGTNIYLPNGQMSNSMVKNFSSEPSRMVEWIISIDYGEQVERVEEAISVALKKDIRILPAPEPYIAVKSLAESGIDITVRVWVKTEDYTSVLHDGNKNIYDEFNARDINFPYPQLTIHQK